MYVDHESSLKMESVRFSETCVRPHYYRMSKPRQSRLHCFTPYERHVLTGDNAEKILLCVLEHSQMSTCLFPVLREFHILEEYLRFLKVKIKIRKCIYFLQLYECLVFLSLIILEATTFRTSHIAVSRITFSVAILKA